MYMYVMCTYIDNSKYNIDTMVVVTSTNLSKIPKIMLPLKDY